MPIPIRSKTSLRPRRPPLSLAVREFCVYRTLPGSLALGRWEEIRLCLEHDYPQPLTVQVFDHVPDGLAVDNLPQSIQLRPGERAELGYRVRPLRRGHLQQRSLVGQHLLVIPNRWHL